MPPSRSRSAPGLFERIREGTVVQPLGKIGHRGVPAGSPRSCGEDVARFVLVGGVPQSEPRSSLGFEIPARTGDRPCVPERGLTTRALWCALRTRGGVLRRTGNGQRLEPVRCHSGPLDGVANEIRSPTDAG
jgi:hypothetical protein